MSQFIRRYLNEIVSLAVMLMLFVALVDAHFLHASQDRIVADDAKPVIVDRAEP